jgi:hypothetical protein
MTVQLSPVLQGLLSGMNKTSSFLNRDTGKCYVSSRLLDRDNVSRRLDRLRSIFHTTLVGVQAIR